MIYGLLFYKFFLIGAFCFGGGYAVIPFIQDTVIEMGWMNTNEFLNMIAVAESTPGPVAINTATYVGFKLAGFSGAAVATLGICTPAFIIVVALSAFLKTVRGQKLLKKLLFGIRPVVVGLIVIAAWTVGRAVLFHGAIAVSNLDIAALALMLAAFAAIYKFKVNPILLIALAAVVGIVLL